LGASVSRENFTGLLPAKLLKIRMLRQRTITVNNLKREVTAISPYILAATVANIRVGRCLQKKYVKFLIFSTTFTSTTTNECIHEVYFSSVKHCLIYNYFPDLLPVNHPVPGWNYVAIRQGALNISIRQAVYSHRK
jgi:hypothetical protein